MMASTAIVAYLALFATVGFLFILVSLLLGKLLRPHAPTEQKLACYECGEPAIGPGTVQFDLRFYVVALVFLIFEVEVALFFPPAVVFGQANRLRDPGLAKVGAKGTVPFLLTQKSGQSPANAPANGSFLELHPMVAGIYREFGVSNPESLLQGTATNEFGQPLAGIPATEDNIRRNTETIERQANSLALASMLDLGVFFAVLLVGFAFVWQRGDLNWIRATRHPSTPMETAAAMSRMRREDY